MSIARILVVDEGHAGHRTQSRGLATALAARTGAAVDVVEARLVLRGAFRPWLRMLVSWFPRGLPAALLRRAYAVDRDIGALQADVVVSSGGSSVPFAVSIARRLGAKYVFCGELGPFPARWCDVILSPVPMPGHPAVVMTELLVTTLSPELVAGRGADYRARAAGSGGRRLGAVLVGGGSRSHRYTEADWVALADGLNRLARDDGWRWLVSTSPRTPRDAGELLASRIDPQWLVKAVWWHRQPERVVMDFLGAADCVFVTQDSLSMVSEAVAAGKPTVTLTSADVRHSEFLESVLTRQQQGRRLRRQPIRDLAAFRLSAGDFAPVTFSLADDYAAQVLARLAPPQ